MTNSTLFQRVNVLVPTPSHSNIGSVLCWKSDAALPLGSLVRVPLGKREVLGLVWHADTETTASEEERVAFPLDKLKPITSHLEGIAPLTASWCNLIAFCARYYQRSLGEVALAALPPQLRDLSPVQIERILKKREKNLAAITQTNIKAGAVPLPSDQTQAAPDLSLEQALTLHALDAMPSGTALLFGATGSGKTEVYMRHADKVLQSEPQAQVLVMVPEINLTPQLEERFIARFGADAVVTLHSGITPAQRTRAWLSAHTGLARIVLGTRMAVLASMPHLRLIIVDEEHDPSYKSQDGARHSARDLAVFRGKNEGIPVVLGSATPSIESWHAAQQGRYKLLTMPSRIGEGRLPKVQLVDMRLQGKGCVFSNGLISAIGERVARGEQSLVFLNRRGYAPVLHCADCGWKSECPHCSAFRVYHKIDRSLRCHHCGFSQGVPRACPDCGNLDITTLGRGTEKLEELLAEALSPCKRPDGAPARILRIDADTTRHKGELEQHMAMVHSGEIDVLVGTQMVTKGHDFRNITLVAAVNMDGALYSSDFRAPERLFSLLKQAAGRAGRDSAQSAGSELWLQTHFPDHPLFAALRKYDFTGFAAQQIEERKSAAMPPFSFQALIRAEARSQQAAQDFLRHMRELAHTCNHSLGFEHITIYPPVPMGVQRVANIERAQMLVESSSRTALQNFLPMWQDILRQHKNPAILRWAMDVDPLQI